MRIIFIGNVAFSHATLRHILENKLGDVVGVVTKKESAFNSDHRSLEDLANTNQIPLLFQDSPTETQLVEWTKQLKPDVIYCFGWSNLLPAALLSVPRLGAVGYHPAALPAHRGRHPIVWALALGLTQTASTFFFLDEDVDAGDILDQQPVDISLDDDAQSLYSKLVHTAKSQITHFTAALADNTFKRIPQDRSKVSYWPKRTKDDGQIRWHMKKREIFNLVRALTKPYVGAHCEFENRDIKIWKAEEADVNEPIEAVRPGSVVKVDGRVILVKCGDGLIKLNEHDFSPLPKEGTVL